MATATAATGTGTGTARKTPAPKTGPGTTATGNRGTAVPASTTMEQHLKVLSEGNVSTQDEIFAFAEAARALHGYLGWSFHSAAAQVADNARGVARNRKPDGRLTTAEKVKLSMVFRKIAKLLEGAADANLSAAGHAVKGWSLMEQFLDGLESTQIGKPGKKNGFTLT